VPLTRSSPAPETLCAMTNWDFHEGDEIAPGLRAVRLLGGGRRYEAHLAWADRLRALVVVKVVRPEQAGDAAALEGIRREAALLRALAHPMLLRSFGAAVDGDRPHLVLEHIEGPRLSTLLRGYGMTIEQVLPLALNLCAVLHYLAQEDVVHLDVKPSNIIMGGEPRLIDLSIARRVDELGELVTPVGTDRWMAPEQADVDRFGEIGPASDVYGLGATLRAALPERVPASLAAAVDACLAPRPGDRPAAGELADLLEPMVDALPAPRLGRFRPSPRRRNHHQQEVLR
jgi:eukaryotic-like serine/threonine-protein kinase